MNNLHEHDGKLLPKVDQDKDHVVPKMSLLLPQLQNLEIPASLYKYNKEAYCIHNLLHMPSENKIYPQINKTDKRFVK